jgi:uncharacterized protein (DUF1330 family)
MTAYTVSDVEVVDEEVADVYRKLALPTIGQYGGHYVVRGTPEAVEGAWPQRRIIMICEWPDLDRAKAWYDSPEYAEALKLSRVALDRRLLFIDGLPE